jgi:NAD-dependent aldehyde dehydrogenases
MGLRKPVGVVAAIAPWNAALILSARSIAAPLALGNTVVLKPSELSPVVGGLIWGEVFAEAGLPAGVLNIVTHAPGEAAPIGDELVENPAVRRINFTGSTEDRAQARGGGGQAAEARRPRARRLQPDDRAERRRPRLRRQRLGLRAFLHQGQICMSARRIYVERGIADAFTSRLADKAKTLKAGNPAEHDTIIGPLINESALSMVSGRVDDAVAKGAKVLAGGEAVGPCYQATVITDVPADSDFAKFETFGPVVEVEVVDSAEEAVAKANDTTYGLSAGIFTSDTDRGFQLAQQIDSGIVHVNDQSVGDEPQMPFGGVKDSGWGRFGGQAVVDEFTELRWITVQGGTGHPFPF